MFVGSGDISVLSGGTFLSESLTCNMNQQIDCQWQLSKVTSGLGKLKLLKASLW